MFIYRGDSSENYSLDQDGNLTFVENGKVKKLCNFIFEPTHINYKVIGNQLVFDSISLRGKLKGNNELPNITLSSSDLERSNWIKKWHPVCRIYDNKSKNYQEIIEYLHSFFKLLPQNTLFDSVGWQFFNNTWIYVYSDGAFSDVLQNRERVKTRDLAYKFLECSKATPEEAFHKTMEILNLCDNKLTYSLLSFLLTSLLLTPLEKVKKISPNFSLWIYGKSGLGKTTLATTFTQLFQIRNLISVNSFRNKIKKSRMLFKDCVLIVDDFVLQPPYNVQKLTVAVVQ